MARRQFKQWWTRYVPSPVERSTYVLLASLCLLLLFWQWRPMPAIVWGVNDPDVAVTDATVSLEGWIIVLTSTFMINQFELFGLDQVANHLTDRGTSIVSTAKRCRCCCHGVDRSDQNLIFSKELVKWIILEIVFAALSN